MAKGKKKASMPSRKALAEGYHLAVLNASRLFRASSAIVADHHPAALAIAQIGQEETGKSFLLLAAIGLHRLEEPWSWFWAQWRDHRAKAHRAYLYEILNPQRIEFEGTDGRRFDGRPLRDNIAKEKEHGLYLDYDPVKDRFTAPSDATTGEEAWSRLMTLGYLTLTASAVHDTLFKSDSEFRLYAFLKSRSVVAPNG